MIFADGTIVQLDAATLIAIAGTLAAGMVAAVTAGAKILCGYLAKRDELCEQQRQIDQQRRDAATEAQVKRLEGLLAASAQRDEAHDSEFRLLYDKLLSLHSSTASVMGEMKTAMLALSERVAGIERIEQGRGGIEKK